MALKWRQTARDKQVTPDGDWRVWLLLSGRGFGKTTVGAHDIAEYACFNPGSVCGVIAPTHSDLRRVCFEGPAGLLSFIPDEVLRGGSKDKAYVKSPWPELHFACGSKLEGFSGSEPERLRGPQFHRVWADEVCAWSDGNAVKIREAWDMLMFCLRLGESPQAIVTTTPKPITLIGDLLKRENKDVIVTRGSTHENKANLPKSFYADIVKYEGTDLGRQEIYGEFLDPEERGIVHRSWFKLWPSGTALPPFHYVVMSYRTPYSAKTKEGYVACSMWGIFRSGPKKTDPFNALMFDCWHDKLLYPDFKRRVLKDWEQEYGQGTLTKEQMKSIIASPWDRPGDMVGRRPALALIADEGSSRELLHDLSARGIQSRAYTNTTDRTMRLHLVSDLIKDGLVWLPESETTKGRPKTWCGEFVNQVCTYVDEKSLEHSEYVDSSTQALGLLRDQGWIVSKMPMARPEDSGPRAPQEYTNPYAM